MGLGADQERDEITEYLNGQYIGSVESCWHIFEFAMHAESPTVYRLPVHLEDQQMVYFDPDDNIMLPRTLLLLLGSKSINPILKQG